MQSTPADRLRQEGNPMNYVMLSPHFPVNYKHFAMRLKARGVNVLGIASEPYESLDPDLRESLTEYYRVEDMEDYKDMFRACAFLSFRHGKLDRIESHNEYWLETDAALRTDFNVPGDKTGDVWRVRHKSAMKEIFRNAGVPVIRGAVLRTREEILALAGEVGFPLCAKPDDGVGACGTFKIHDLAELDRFLQQKPSIDYMVEEYIEGRIETFDGLADRDRNILFCSSYVYAMGILDVFNQDLDNYYFTVRNIPADLEDCGRRTVEAFGLKERFFHIEFFRKKDGTLAAMELNARPPGGASIDMFNYANDIDVYDLYARLVAGETFEPVTSHPYFCAYVGLKVREGLKRKYSHADIMGKYGHLIMEHFPLPEAFARVMGQYAYIFRTPERSEMEDVIRYIGEME